MENIYKVTIHHWNNNTQPEAVNYFMATVEDIKDLYKNIADWGYGFIYWVGTVDTWDGTDNEIKFVEFIGKARA